LSGFYRLQNILLGYLVHCLLMVGILWYLPLTREHNPVFSEGEFFTDIARAL
jgi:hypothetical protein